MFLSCSNIFKYPLNLCINICVGRFLFESAGTSSIWQLVTFVLSYSANQAATGCILQYQKEESTLFVFEASELDPKVVIIPVMMMMTMMMMMMMMMVMVMVNYGGNLNIWVVTSTFSSILQLPIFWSIHEYELLGLGMFAAKFLMRHGYQTSMGSLFTIYIQTDHENCWRWRHLLGIPLDSIRMAHHRARNSRHVAQTVRPEEFGQYLLCCLANRGCKPDGPSDRSTTG